MTQCDRCSYDGVRGGVVFPAQRACEFVEGHQSKVNMVLERLCQQAAEHDKCPVFEPAEHPPDSYRSEDLPREPWAART